MHTIPSQVTDKPEFDMDFRPRSYWEPCSKATYFGSRITGQWRKNNTLSRLDEADPEDHFFSSTLPVEMRDYQSSLHPWLMGSEYLPKLYPKEAEIARVVYKSTTMDVYSIRALQRSRNISYRIVDEYSSRFLNHQKTSLHPLSVNKLISIIDHCAIYSENCDQPEEYGGLVLCYYHCQLNTKGNHTVTGLPRLFDFHVQIESEC